MTIRGSHTHSSVSSCTLMNPCAMCGSLRVGSCNVKCPLCRRLHCPSQMCADLALMSSCQQRPKREADAVLQHCRAHVDCSRLMPRV